MFGLHLNLGINGLKKRHVYDGLNQLLFELNHKPVFVALTETWLSDTIDSYNIANYVLFSKPRSRGNWGGVGIYVSSNYDVVIEKLDTSFASFEYLVITVYENKDILSTIAVIYRPPSLSLKLFLDEFPNFLKFLNTNIIKTNTKLIVAGDFNINLLHVDSNAHVSHFADIIYSNFLFPLIHRPTRITNKTAILIDNIFINCHDTILSGLLTLDLSDHLPIFVVFEHESKVKIDQKPQLKYHTNFSSVRNMLERENWNFITDSSNVDHDYNSLVCIIRNCLNSNT
jgi:hypothetical protein